MKFDLHIHSRSSYDSLSSLTDVVAHAKRIGLNGIAITDHNVFTATELMKRQTSDSFLIINGAEVQTEAGDIIALFIHKPLRNKAAASLIEEIHDQNGIAVLAHPFKRIANYPHEILEKLDAIEVVNARWQDLNSMKRDARVNQVLSTVRGRTAGSDAHFIFEIGRAYWETHELNSMEDLKENIRKGDGRAITTSFSNWPQVLSQVIKFSKHPSPREFARIYYYFLRSLMCLRLHSSVPPNSPK